MMHRRRTREQTAEASIRSILLELRYDGDLIEQFLRVSGNINASQRSQITRDLIRYLDGNKTMAANIRNNIRCGVLGVNSPLHQVADELERIYGKVLKHAFEDIPSVKPHAEGSSTTGVRGRDTSTTFRFNGADGSDLDTFVVLNEHSFDKLYDAYLRSTKTLRNGGTSGLGVQFKKYCDFLHKSPDEVTIRDIDPNLRATDFPFEGYGRLRQARLQYDKGILRGHMMEEAGWLDSLDKEQLHELVGRETTASVVREGGEFDASGRRCVNLSETEPSGLPLSCKVAIVISVIGSIIGFVNLAMSIESIISDGASIENCKQVMSSLVQGVLGAETARQTLLWQEVSPWLIKIGGGLAVADGLYTLVDGVQRGDGYRITKGGVEIVAGTLIVSGYSAAGGVLLGGLVAADGIREMINGNLVKGGIRATGGGLLVASAVCAMIPGVGNITAIGLGAAAVVVLLSEMIADLFIAPKTAPGPGGPPRAIRRRGPALPPPTADTSYVIEPNIDRLDDWGNIEDIIVEAEEVSMENKTRRSLTWNEGVLTWAAGSRSWTDASVEIGRAGHWIEGNRVVASVKQSVSGSRAGTASGRRG